VSQLSDGYDHLLVVTRGGMIPAALISQHLEMRDILAAAVLFYAGPDRALSDPQFLQFPSDALVRGKRVLVVDDIWDTGCTAVSVSDRLRCAGASADVAVLHYKPTRSKFPDRHPDFYVEETADWIVYPWELDDA
jgi:hypoxanthine phosphoribosyltransferase